MTEAGEPGITTEYFNWLYHQVFEVLDLQSPQSYAFLCTQLHRVPFYDGVPNDDNRTADGLELRNEFISTLGGITIEDYTALHNLGQPSLLEVFIGLARHADYIVSMGIPVWVRRFLENLGLLEFDDAHYRPRDRLKIMRKLRIFNQRQYTRSGEGGLFPLYKTRRDQRRVELWYQMNAYMTENKMY